MNFVLGVLRYWFLQLPIGMEFSLTPTDMVRKPQDKPVMEYRDMKVGA